MKVGIPRGKKGLGAVERQFLCEIGLSGDAVELYERTLRARRLTAAGAAGNSGKYPSAQYRLFYRLEHYGLVQRLGGRPRVFVAVGPERAFPVALNTKRSELDTLLHGSVFAKHPAAASGLRLLMGKEALYSEYALMAAGARRSIDLYTIGIAYSPELLTVQQGAVRRGVRVRHIVQQVKLSNLHVVSAWQKAGVSLRKSQAERGFHLMVFDDTLAIASFSNPADTEDRLSIITDNPAALSMFRRYFEQLWKGAEELSV